MSSQTPAKSIFWGDGLSPLKRNEQRKRIFDKHPGVFGTVEEVGAFLERVDAPASLRWALAINPKCANTSVKRFLFRLEYGCELSAAYTSPFDINSDSPAQRLSFAGVYRNLWQLEGAEGILDGALRLTTSRHPVARAASMFNYLCRSNTNGHSFFVNDRLRMNAAVGFDWQGDTYTPKGFIKFLDFVALSYEETTINQIDFHWRRQVDTVRPTVFKPDIIGNVDRMDDFYIKTAERLNQEHSFPTELTTSNRSTTAERIEKLLTPAALERIVMIYRADFDWLGVQSDEWKCDIFTPTTPPPAKKSFVNRRWWTKK